MAYISSLSKKRVISKNLLGFAILLCKTSFGLLIFPSGIDAMTNETLYESITISSTLPWSYHFNVSQVAVVDLQMNQTIFDFCDLNSFTPSGVKPLLEYFNIHQSDLDNGLQWIALYPTQSCQPPFSDYNTSYVTLYDTVVAKYIKNTGAIG